MLRFIAERTQTNIRELEGSLTRVMAHSELRAFPSPTSWRPKH